MDDQPTMRRTDWFWVAGSLLAVLFVMGGIGIVIGIVFAKPPPDPIAYTTPSPGTSSPSAGSAVTAKTFSVKPGPAWRRTESKDTSLEFAATSGKGLLFIQSDHQRAEATGPVLADIQASTQRKYPDVRACVDPQPLLVGGAAGTVLALCYTFIPQSGRAYPATDLFWAATSRDGRTFYLYEVFAPADSFNAVNRDAQRVMQTVTWKLG